MPHTRDFLGSKPFALLTLMVLIPTLSLILYFALAGKTVQAQEELISVNCDTFANGVVHLRLQTTRSFQCEPLKDNYEDCQARFWQALHEAQQVWENNNPGFFELNVATYGLQVDGLLPRGVVILYQPQVDVPALQVYPMVIPKPDPPVQPPAHNISSYEVPPGPHFFT